MRVFLVLLICVFPTVSQGQGFLADSAFFSLKLSVGGNYNAGNFKKLGLVNNADVIMNTRKDKYGLESQTQYVYTKIFGEVSENNVLTRTLAYYTFKRRWSVFGIFWFETNKLRQIEPLIQTGGSLRYKWLLNTNGVGAVSVGMTYEHKRFLSSTFSDSRYNGRSDIRTPRLFLRAVGKNRLKKTGVSVNYDLYYMPSLKYENNHRYHAEASLSIPITKYLNIQTGFQYNYENVVVATVRPNDFFTSYGISLVF